MNITTHLSQRPVVLCCSGHDPIGGAGLQADIEACAANGADALTLVTALTAQDSQNVQAIYSIPLSQFRHAGEVLLADVRPSVVKLGLMASEAQVGQIAEWLQALQCPVVMDPILKAGGGTPLVQNSLLQAMQWQLFPKITVLTPNVREAFAITGQSQLLAAGEALLAMGPQHVLMTGGDEAGAMVCNWLFSQDQVPQCFEWPRLAGGFHGAGCTLAAAIAACLARGLSVAAAIAQAQAYTHQALAQARTLGAGRALPGRRL